MEVGGGEEEGGCTSMIEGGGRCVREEGYECRLVLVLCIHDQLAVKSDQSDISQGGRGGGGEGVVVTIVTHPPLSSHTTLCCHS